MSQQVSNKTGIVHSHSLPPSDRTRSFHKLVPYFRRFIVNFSHLFLRPASISLFSFI